MGKEQFQPSESGEFERETLRVPEPSVPETQRIVTYDARLARAILNQISTLQKDVEAFETEAVELETRANQFQELEGPATASVLRADALQLRQKAGEKRKHRALLNAQLGEMEKHKNPFDQAA